MEEPRWSVTLDNGCKSVLSIWMKQCLGGQTLLAEDAEFCQPQLASMPGVSVLAFGKQLLKERYGTESLLWNLGLHRKPVLKTRLSPGSQVVQFTAIAAVILSYNGSLWKLRDLQMLPEVINTLCLPFTYSKSWNWPQASHGTQDKHPYSTRVLLHTALNCPGHVCAAVNPHEHIHTYTYSSASTI